MNDSSPMSAPYGWRHPCRSTILTAMAIPSRADPIEHLEDYPDVGQVPGRVIEIGKWLARRHYPA